MIENIISFSIKNKFLILMATLFITFGSFWALKNTPLGAIPDLSPPQVIVQVNWAGQSPEIIEDQGTYPLVSQFLAIANIETVRGFSTYENALIYIIFKEGIPRLSLSNIFSRKYIALPYRSYLPCLKELEALLWICFT